jgi:spore coat assembly protein
MKQGDYVVRKSYGGDILFRIEAIVRQTAILKGVDYRLLADALLSDLIVVRQPETSSAAVAAKIKEHESLRRFRRQEGEAESFRFGTESGDDAEAYRQETANPPGGYFEMPGRVLHLDGDSAYLRKSMALYAQMNVPADCIHCHESVMPEVLGRLLPQVRPDIVVITGHDGVLKNRPYASLRPLSSYKNSVHFVQAVRTARAYEPDKDNLIIVAGACQSHFEALLMAGANFASSPRRVMIHALDPVVVAIKASRTPFREPIHLTDAIRGTICGAEGMGGVETFGKRRLGTPRPGWNAKKVVPAYGA